jgi:hypothetical protein
MHQKPLDGSFAKIEWAKSEIGKLEDRINALLEDSPKMLSSYLNEQGIEVRRLTPPSIPNNLKIEVGNIIQNLRAPLDKALSAVAILHQSSHKGVQFPFGNNRDHFEEALARQKNLPEDAKSIIRRARPYMTANPVLCAINSLNIPDKHHPDLVPISVGAIFDLETIVIRSGELFSIGPRRGRHLFPDRDKNLRQPNFDRQPIIQFEGKAVVRCGVGLQKSDLYLSIFYNQMGSGLAPDLDEEDIPDFSGAPLDDLEVLTCSPGAVLDVEIKPSFNFALGGIERLEREPVSVVLRQAADQVEHLLLAFEHRFFT